MKRTSAFLAAVILLAAALARAQVTTATTIVLNCRESVRLSGSAEAILHQKCSDGKVYISKAGGAFVEYGTGSVTSIGISGASGMSVTGSPITGSGTIALAWQSQLANLFLASPSGSSGAPTFRAVVAADIPNLAESQITNLSTDLAAKAPLASPTFTGDPQAPTPATADSDTSIPTTAMVHAAITADGVEVAQDAAGAMATDTATIDVTYTDATPAMTWDVKAASITEAMQVLADNTTNDVTVARHGFAPKAPNDASKFLDGTGAFANLTVARIPLSAASLMGRYTAGAGAGQQVGLGGGLEFSGTTLQVSAFTGDVTKSAGGTVMTITTAAVADAMLRNSAALSVIGRASNTSGAPADIATSADGDVLRRSGTSLGFGTIATAGIANDAVTYAKMQNVSATNRVLGRNTAGSGDTEEVTLAQLLAWGSITYDSANTRYGINVSPTRKFEVSDGNYNVFDDPGTSSEFHGIRSVSGLFGFGWLYDGDLKLFRHQNDATGVVALTVLRASGDMTAAANFTASGTLTGANISTAGTVTVAGSVLGAWTTFTPTRTAGSGTWTGGTVTTAAYKIENKSMTILLTVDGSSLSATPTTISIAIPASKTATYGIRQPASITDAGTARTGTARVAASGTTIDFTPREDFTGTWTGGANTSVSISITFAIN